MVEFVRGRQDQAYNQLADELGISSAKSVHDKIAGLPLPPDLQQRFGSAHLPTPLEDPRMYTVMTQVFAGLSRECDDFGTTPLPHPFFATLPAGDIDATTVEEPSTKTPVVFFEQGLFSFFYDMAKLMAWAAPPLTEAQLTDDVKLAEIRNSFTMPMHATEYFVGTLSAYAQSGSPVAESTPIPEPEHNLYLSVNLLNQMVRFAMGHELAHIRERDGEKPQTPELEYHADSLAVSLVTTLADNYHGSWAVGYWGCELALVALNLLYKTIGLFTFGVGAERLTWISQTHPEPLKRRENLRGIWLNPRSPKPGVAAARMVSAMMEALFKRLWEIGSPGFFLLYERGERASPRWRNTVERLKAVAAKP